MKQEHRYMIEGETVTLRGIADRAGLSRGGVLNKLRRVADAGPVTWEALRARKKPGGNAR